MFFSIKKENLVISNIVLTCFALSLFLFVFNTPVEAQRNEGSVSGIWNFDDGTANDSSNKGLNGVIVGDSQSVNGIAGKALEFNGTTDSIHIPDSPNVNITNIITNRTIAAFFNCKDVSKNQKQVIFEEGGRTRGLVLYVFEGKVYIGGWNRAEYNWNGEWLSADVKSNRWYHVALVIRDAEGKVESDRLEMWLDGRLVEKSDGGQLHPHGDDNAIGSLKQNVVYHDEGGGITGYGDWFHGLIDEVLIYNSAFDQGDFNELVKPLSVEAEGKSTTTWGRLKSQRLTD